MMNDAVERAIKCIWERYGESLTLADLARSAILSKFHFCRTFSEATGVSPGRFLSAVRIYQAKRLLLTTSMNVTDISFAVGYNSLGSFTNHFTESVGVPPRRYRRICQDSEFDFPGPLLPPPSFGGTVSGTISVPEDCATARVYLGVFKTPIDQARPAAAAVVPITAAARQRTYNLEGVPAGKWFVHAAAVADSIDPEPWTRRVLLVGTSGPVNAADDTRTRATVPMRAKRPTDLPALFALPDLEAILDESALTPTRSHERLAPARGADNPVMAADLGIFL
jgi:AraC family transcriptional regulator